MKNGEKRAGAMLNQPGIYKIECIPKKRAYFGIATYSMFFDVGEFMIDLKKGEGENEQLINGFKFYGIDQFNIDVVVTGKEYCDQAKLTEALEKAKADWPDELY